MLAAGDGFTEVATEPASIDVVGALPVGDAPAERGDAGAGRSPRWRPRSLDLPVELNEAVLSCIDLYQGRLRDWFDGGALARPEVPAPHPRGVRRRRASRRTSPTSPSSRAPSSRPPTRGRRPAASGSSSRATGRRYGLQQDWWVDERSDPEKATRAAARYLKELYVMFGDWNLALAGYNAGEMKVVRAMKKYNTSDFWELRRTRGFRSETKNYVPLIHAAIVIAKSPERYGFTVATDEPPDSERVAIEGAYDLRVDRGVRERAARDHPVAQPASCAAWRRPPTARSSSGCRPAAPRRSTECLGKLPEEKRVSFRTHVVRRGQTLASIARANGVTHPRHRRSQQPRGRQAPAPRHRADHPDPGAARASPPARHDARGRCLRRGPRAPQDPARRHARLDRRPVRHDRDALCRRGTGCAGRRSPPEPS